MLDQSRQNFHRVGLDDKFVIFGADVFGNLFGVFQLAEILFFKADGKSFDGLSALLRHQRDDGRRIDAARKKRAERNFGNHSAARRFAQDPQSFFFGFALRKS